MGIENRNSSNSRSHVLISLISLIAGLILAWLGYKNLQATGLPGISGQNVDISDYIPLVSAILGIALIVSGFLGLLRGRVL